MKEPLKFKTSELEWAYTSVLSSSWLFYFTICTYVHTPYIAIRLRLRIYFLVLYDCNSTVMCAHGQGRMTEAQWLISGRLDVQRMERATQRWDTESEEEKGKLSFTGKESQIDSGKTLRPKTNKKLGFARKQKLADLDPFTFGLGLHTTYEHHTCTETSLGSYSITKSRLSLPPDDHHLSSISNWNYPFTT